MNPLALLSPYTWVAYLVGAIALVSVGAYGMHHWDEVAYLKLQQSIIVANEKALASAEAKQKSLDAASNAAEIAYLKANPVIVTQTQTVIRNVNHYITQKADTNFPLSLGFCILLDAAASGSGAAASSDPAPVSDAAACPVAASDAAATIAGNYGQYREIAAELTALQEWVRTESEVLSTSK